MKKILIAILLLCFVAGLHAQFIKINWQHCYTYNYKEYINTVSAVGTGNGAFILRNRQENYPNGYTRIYLENIDLNDNVLWGKYFSSSEGAGCRKIVKVDENNFYILGITSHGGGDVTYNPYENTVNIWVIKIDSSGNKLWDKVIGGTGGDYPQDIAVSTDGGVVVSATFGSYYGGPYVGDASKYYGFWDMWVVKLNKDDGHIEWDYTLGSSEYEFCHTSVTTSDGGCIAGGVVASASDGNVACIDESGQFIGQGVVLKLNAQGEQEWQKCYGSSDEDAVFYILETADGYVVVGTSRGEDQDLEDAGYHLGYDHLGNKEDDIWVFKIDKQGNLLWSKCFGGTSREYPCKLFQTIDGEIVVFGQTESYDGDAIRKYNDEYFENYDIWMLKLSAQGDLLWQRCIGNRGDQEIYDGIAMLDDNNYIIAANSYFGSVGDLTCGTNYDSTHLAFSWIAHITDTTDGYGLGKEDIEACRYIKVYPNPAGEYAVFSYTLPAGTTGALLLIRDLYGRLVKEVTLQGNEGKEMVDTRTLSPGTYIYTLWVGTKRYNGKLMVAQ